MAIVEINEKGFTRETLIGVKADIDSRVTDAIGPVNTAADSVVGQYNGAIAEVADLVIEAIQDAYFSMYPLSASGTSLDHAVSFVGIERIQPTFTKAVAVCYGKDSTLIPAGSIASTENNRQYKTQADSIISLSVVAAATFSISDVQPSTFYQISMGPNPLAYTSGDPTTEAEILAGLAASALSHDAEVEDSKLMVVSADKMSGHALTTTANIKTELIGSPALFVAEIIGLNPLPANSLSKIVTSISGWDSVLNLASSNEGKNSESDSELRARYRVGVRGTGASTVNAIKAKLLQEVEGVSSVSIYENRSNLPLENGQPAHSFNAVVQGGINSEIASKIFDIKAAGIETYGNVSNYIQDSNGDTQIVQFSRPVLKYAWVKISGTRYTEEDFPTNYKETIIAACLAYGESLNVGEDIISQRFYGPVFESITGLATLSIEISTTDDDSGTPVYTTGNISISKYELSVFDASRITVGDI